MSRVFYSVAEIRTQNPGQQALIIQSNVGEIILLKTNDTPPEGKWCLLATVGPNG